MNNISLNTRIIDITLSEFIDFIDFMKSSKKLQDQFINEVKVKDYTNG
jgi:hypothetical protein